MRLILIHWVIGFHVLANAEDESYDHYDYYTYDEEPDGLTPGTAIPFKGQSFTDLKKELEADGRLFEDPLFWANETSIDRSGRNLLECIKEMKSKKCKITQFKPKPPGEGNGGGPLNSTKTRSSYTTVPPQMTSNKEASATAGSWPR